MRTLRLGQIVALLLCFTFFACNKENVETNPSPTLSKQQILVKNTWQVDELLVNNSGNNSHYIRGGINTTGINYDAVRITFKSDGTGTYTTDRGQTFPSTWKFTSTDEQNMELSVIYPTVVTYTWNIVEINENALYNTTALSTEDNDLLVSARYVPVH